MSKKLFLQLGVLLLCISSFSTLFAFKGNDGPNPTSSYVNESNIKTPPPFVVNDQDLTPFSNSGWSSKAPMIIKRWAHATAFYRSGTYPNDTGFVYVISGGNSTFDIINSMVRYNTVTNTWTDAAPMPIGKAQISAVTIGDKIYVPGGYNPHFTATNQMYIYDIPTDTWSQGADMPAAVGDYAIAKYGTLIYVMGGFTGSSDINTVQVYSTTTNSWRISPNPLPWTAVSGHRGGTVDYNFVLVGGYSQNLGQALNQSLIGKLSLPDSTAFTWFAGPNYPVTSFRSGVSNLELNSNSGAQLNKSYVLFTAGDPSGSGTTALKNTYAFDFGTFTWLDGPDKITAVNNLCNLVSYQKGDSLYMMTAGGYDGASVTTVNEILNMGSIPPPAALLSPVNDAIGVANGATFDWHSIAGATSYKFQISLDSAFGNGNILWEETTDTTSQLTLGMPLFEGTKYFWRVRASNSLASGVYSGRFSFTSVPFAPSAPSDLALLVTGIGKIKLNWTDNSSGPANEEKFIIQRKDNVDTSWITRDSVPGDTINWRDSSLTIGRTYYYRVYAVNSGGVSANSNEVNTVITSLTVSNEIPKEFALYQNYPNPFNPSTKIKYDIPKAGFVSLKIYDITGREIAKLVDKELAPAQYEVDWDASNFFSGVYFYRLQAGDFVKVQRMILVK